MTHRIRAALERHLAAMPNVLPIAYQNFPFPAEGQAMPDRYLECFVLPARNVTPSLRFNSTLHRGIFQINVSYPAAIGAGEAEQMASQIQAHFAPGLALEFGGIEVRVMEKADVGRPFDRPGAYVIPVSVSYKSIF